MFLFQWLPKQGLLLKKSLHKKRYTEFKNQDFFLAAGKNSDIRFFNINNGECFIGIETLFEELIDGIIVLNNGLILTYTKNGEIKIWTFDLNYIY